MKFYLTCAGFLVLIFCSLNLSAQQLECLYQYGNIASLQKGYFEDDTFNVKQLKKAGNFGLGTFNHLDGELILLNGEVYQGRFDGNVLAVADSIKIPFAIAVNFNSKYSKLVNLIDKDSLQKWLSKQISFNQISAFKIEGEFSDIKIRSIAPQQKPYPTLSEAAKTQNVYQHQLISGTLVGFYFPTYLSSINVPGYHFHFISNDKKVAGHVLSATINRAKVAIQKIKSLVNELPDNSMFNQMNLTDVNAQDIYKAEH